ncbi:hypothetical protein ACFE04_007654 [Oxalis oulophora]
MNNHHHMEPIAKSARLHNSTSSVEDRLSQLPRDVAHHVLSFLPIHDLAKLSFTSKKYYKLCLSVPSLVFNDSEISFRKGSVERDQLMCFIKRLLTSHRGTKMTTLHIEWPTKGEASRIKSWLNHAIDCQVNEIILILDHRSGLFVIPVNVLRCESLTSLLHDIKFVGRSLPFSALLLVHTPNFLNISCYVSLFRHIHVRRSESKYYVDLSLECGYSKNATNHSRLQSSLSSIVQVTDLKTNCCSIKAMHQYKCLPIAFTNLQSLIFQYDPVDYFLFPATTLFLQGLAHSLKKLLIRNYVPIKLAYKLMELVSANGAAFRLQGKSMVLELKPQLVADTLEN